MIEDIEEDEAAADEELLHQSGTTGMVIGIEIADGGMIVRCNAPKEAYKHTAVVAGDFTSANCRKSVQRHIRRFVKEWLS